MASLVLSVAGAAIGGAIGGPVGAQIGFALGSAAGGILFPPKTPDGPRLGDLTVHTSNYGNAIPITYGTNRLAGNVIWAAQIQEHANAQDGKGGPAYTTYSYTCSFAVSVCEGPVAGITRIWADGLLVYDTTPANTGPNQTFIAAGFKFYLGTEAQLPDPTIQASIGDTPAYRGQAYAVFTDLQLEKYGNRIPSLTFEVSTAISLPTSTPAVLLGLGSDIEVDPATGYIWAPYRTADSTSLLKVNVYDPATLATVTTISAGLGYADTINIARAGSAMFIGQEGNATVGNVVNKISTLTNAVVASGNTNSQTAVTKYGHIAADGFGNLTISATNGIGHLTVGFADGVSDYVFPACSGAPLHAYPNLCGPGGVGGDRTDWVFESVFVPASNKTCFVGYGGWMDTSDGQSVANTAWGAYPTAHRLLLIKGTAKVIWAQVGFATIFVVDTSGLTPVLSPLLTAGGNVQALYFNGDNNKLFVDIGSTVLSYNITSGLQGDSYPQSAFATGQMQGASIHLGNGVFVACESTSSHLSRVWKVSFSVVAVGGPVVLKDIVADVSNRAKLAAPDIDVSELTDLVDGFTITHQMAARSAVEVLMPAYFFDPVESDYQIKFRKRGRPSVATIADDDIAAHAGGMAPPELIETVRKQETDLPQVVTVKYLNAAADYQTSSQYAARLTGRSQSAVTIDMPIVLSDAKANAVANAALYSAWAERDGIRFSTSRRYATMEPTDMAVIHGRLVRIVHKKVSGGVIEWEAYADSRTLYASGTTLQQGSAAVAGSVTQTLVAVPQTILQLLDIPLLQDTDAMMGFYMAATGANLGWPGAQVFKSTDGGLTYAALAAIPGSSLIGGATTALGTYAGGDTFDELNTVTVALLPSSSGATLSSATMLAVLNGANAALIGKEIVQFRSALLNADGTYTLSGLLRGRRGTEWAMGSHANGDRFVLLGANLVDQAAPLSEIGLPRTYKAVTSGNTLASATAVSFTNTGTVAKPYAPVQIGGGRDATGNLTITWIRRSRVDGGWRDGVDVPIGETTEAYDVEVTDAAGVLKRTVSGVTSAQLTYTAAMQTADFGSVQGTVYLHVYQLSATVGRGTPGKGVV